MIGIGIDVGGTYIKCAVTDEQGRVIKTARFDTGFEQGPKVFLKEIARFINEWKKEFNAKKVTLGIALPGDVDHVKGVLRFGTNLKYKGKHIINLPVAREIEKLTGIKPIVGNDANLAAWGYYNLEHRTKEKNVLVIALGTGVGGGVILNGELYQGSRGCAGEIGHMKLDLSLSAPPCGCGARGCVEAFVGTKGIKNLVAKEVKARPHSLLARETEKNKNFKIELVFNTALAGCAAAKRVWEEAGFYLGSAIANCGMLLDLDSVILTGGVSRADKFYMPSLKKVLAMQKIKTPFKNLKILVSPKADVGCIGAAHYSLFVHKNAKK